MKENNVSCCFKRSCNNGFFEDIVRKIIAYSALSSKISYLHLFNQIYFADCRSHDLYGNNSHSIAHIIESKFFAT